MRVGWEVDSGLNRCAPEDHSDQSRKRFQWLGGNEEVNKEATAGVLVRDAEAQTRLGAQSWREVKGSTEAQVQQDWRPGRGWCLLKEILMNRFDSQVLTSNGVDIDLDIGHTRDPGKRIPRALSSVGTQGAGA